MVAIRGYIEFLCFVCNNEHNPKTKVAQRKKCITIYLSYQDDFGLYEVKNNSLDVYMIYFGLVVVSNFLTGIISSNGNPIISSTISLVNLTLFSANALASAAWL